jgi:hypothetical protein
VKGTPLVAIATAFVTSLATSAVASPAFGTDLERSLDLGYEPPCTLCHADEGSVSTPFGRALVQRGLVGKDPGTLSAALDRMRADGTDSDGDGAEDLDELSWGRDPNVPDLPSEPEVPPPTYGCAMRRDSARDRPSMVVSLALAVLYSRRRRR